MPHRRHPHAVWKHFFTEQRRQAREEGDSSWSESPARLAAGAAAALGVRREKPADDHRPYATLLPQGVAARLADTGELQPTGDSRGVLVAPAEPASSWTGASAASSSSAAPAVGATGLPASSHPHLPADEPQPTAGKRWRAGRKRGSGRCKRQRRAAAAATLREVEEAVKQEELSSDSREPSCEHGLSRVASASTSPAVRPQGRRHCGRP